MSAPNIWEHLYFDTARELDELRRRLLNEWHEERIKVIRLEGHRLTLLSHLRSAAVLCKHDFPIVSARYIELAQEIADDYPAKPHSEAAGVEKPVPRHPDPLPNASLYAASGADPFGTATSRDAS